MNDGDWQSHREYDKPGLPVCIWNLLIGSIFGGTVVYETDNGCHWHARLNTQALGGYATAEQVMAVVDCQLWVEAPRERAPHEIAHRLLSAKRKGDKGGVPLKPVWAITTLTEND